MREDFLQFVVDGVGPGARARDARNIEGVAHAHGLAVADLGLPARSQSPRLNFSVFKAGSAADSAVTSRRQRQGSGAGIYNTSRPGTTLSVKPEGGANGGTLRARS